MQPFRRHVALAVDGGGIRGVLVARALALLEAHLGLAAHDIFRLTAGTSTGSIISAGIAKGLNCGTMHELYSELGTTVFRKSWRSAVWPLSKYRYSHAPLLAALEDCLGTGTMGELWSVEPRIDVVITLFDLVEQRTRFVKPWKPEYASWSLAQSVLASCSVPTYFPAVDGRFVDGGVGSYANPAYLAAYEAYFCLGWDPAETTLISLGTGRTPATLHSGDANRFWAWEWLGPLLDAFLQSADQQQLHLVRTFFEQLDFRRFQVELRESIAMDDASCIPQLTAYGDELFEKILNDQTDPRIELAQRPAPSAAVERRYGSLLGTASALGAGLLLGRLLRH